VSLIKPQAVNRDRIGWAWQSHLPGIAPGITY